MKSLARLVLALGLIFATVGPVLANDDPLFINLTSDDAHRARMALAFGANQLERGHPLTVFLNDRAVHIGSKANASAFAEHQKRLGELMGKGAAVIVCPLCMKHYGVAEGDLIDGLQVGNPDLTGAALFKADTKTLSW
jgi:sulfur relay (sulfurtransferase) complex TusBCD TusD component (DsrE family)